MKFTIIKERYDVLYIDLNSLHWDYKIAEYLGLNVLEYKKILTNCGAFKSSSGDCCFRNKADAEAAVEILEPYLIMAILRE